MKRYLFYLSIVIFVFISCQPGKDKELVNLNLTEEPSVLDFFSDIELVQLETKEDNLIGVISKVVYFKDHFYILDGLTQQFFCFDRGGNFVYKISARGRGPGEYNFITDFTVDLEGERIFILDPVVQRLLLFGMTGEHLETYFIQTEKVMGFNKVYALNDSIILLSSITNNQLIFFNLNQQKVIGKEIEFPIEGPLDAFSPRNNVYKFNGRTFVLPFLGRQIYEITGTELVPHLEWDFGTNNNSIEQIETLIAKIDSRQGDIRYFHNEVGKNKILNHHIIKVYETSRYTLALLEFDNHFRHVFRDKNTQNSYVFNHFKEEIGLMYFHIQQDVAIGFDSGIPERFTNIPERAHRKHGFYHKDFLSDQNLDIITNHDPMTDNPFLVVYRFKE